MNKEFDYTIGDFPDKENLVVDIYYDYHCAEITTEDLDKPIIEFYSHRKNECWKWKEMPLDSCIETIKKAMTHLDRIYTEGSRLGGELTDRWKLK